MFCTQRSRPPIERNVVRTFNAWLAAAGLPREVRLYDLRHSCATLLLAQRVPLRMNMELLGHTDIRTTAYVYAHVLPALADQTADAMDRLLTPPVRADVGQDVGHVPVRRPPGHCSQREMG